jgi:hypothetical protein
MFDSLPVPTWSLDLFTGSEPLLFMLRLGRFRVNVGIDSTLLERKSVIDCPLFPLHSTRPALPC